MVTDYLCIFHQVHMVISFFMFLFTPDLFHLIHVKWDKEDDSRCFYRPVFHTTDP